MFRQVDVARDTFLIPEKIEADAVICTHVLATVAGLHCQGTLWTYEINDGIQSPTRFKGNFCSER